MIARALTSLLALTIVGCAEDGYEPRVPVGDEERGRRALAELECGVCHEIPGVPGAWGRVGPSLAQYARNVYIAGKHPNVPEVLVQFVRDAPSLAHDTAMPAIDMTEEQGRDIAAYLYSLR